MKKQMVMGAGATAAVLAMGAAAMAAPWDVVAGGQLRDLATAAASALDHAAARVTADENGAGSTTVTLDVVGIDHSAAGQTFGAHVHTGPCVEDNGGAAGPHYNAGGGISDDTEVWLDITVEANGHGSSTATVPFEIPEGAAQSVVIHALPTNSTTGAAGARLACLPVDF